MLGVRSSGGGAGGISGGSRMFAGLIGNPKSKVSNNANRKYSIIDVDQSKNESVMDRRKKFMKKTVSTP